MSIAVVLTHATENQGVGEEETKRILEYVDDLEEPKDVYYVPDTVSWDKPGTDNFIDGDVNIDSVDLPVSFEELQFKGYLNNRDLGHLYAEQALDIIKEYELVRVGGATREVCVPNSVDSFKYVIENSDYRSEVEMVDEITFSKF